MGPEPSRAETSIVHCKSAFDGLPILKSFKLALASERRTNFLTVLVAVRPKPAAKVV